MRRSLIPFAAIALSATCVFAGSISDARIAAIVLTANQVDIDAGQLAVNRAASDEVRSFARVMITDHSGVNEMAAELAQRLGVTPEESPTSMALRRGGDENLAALRELDGSAFDEAYVAREVAYHQQVLDALDETLIPNATNPELKELLVRVRPAFAAHLEHARHLHASLVRGH